MLKKCSFNGWVCFWSHSFIRFPSFPAFCMHSALKHVLTLQLSKRMFFEGTIGLLCCLLFLCTPPNPPQWLLLVLQRIFPLLRLHFFFLSSPLLLVNSHGLSIWADSRWKWVSVAWWRAEDWVSASPECLYWQMAVSYWHLCPLVILQLAYLCWSNALIVLAFNSVNAGVSRGEGEGASLRNLRLELGGCWQRSACHNVMICSFLYHLLAFTCRAVWPPGQIKCCLIW